MWVLKERAIKDDTKVFAETERMRLQLPEMRKAMGTSGGGRGWVWDILGLRYLLNIALGTSNWWRCVYMQLITGGGTGDADSGSTIHRWHLN